MLRDCQTPAVTGLSKRPDLGVLLGIGLTFFTLSTLIGSDRERRFAMMREMAALGPVLFLPALVPVVIAAAGATHAVAGGPHDMSEWRGYCLFLLAYAILFSLVSVATYDAVFDD